MSNINWKEVFQLSQDPEQLRRAMLRLERPDEPPVCLSIVKAILTRDIPITETTCIHLDICAYVLSCLQHRERAEDRQAEYGLWKRMVNNVRCKIGRGLARSTGECPKAQV